MTKVVEGAPRRGARSRFSVHARGEDRHRSHPAPAAATAHEAAILFAEHWLPVTIGDGDEAVSVIVRDGDTGEEQCFTIHLDSGDAEPCA